MKKNQIPKWVYKEVETNLKELYRSELRRLHTTIDEYQIENIRLKDKLIEINKEIKNLDLMINKLKVSGSINYKTLETLVPIITKIKEILYEKKDHKRKFTIK